MDTNRGGFFVCCFLFVLLCFCCCFFGLGVFWFLFLVGFFEFFGFFLVFFPRIKVFRHEYLLSTSVRAKKLTSWLPLSENEEGKEKGVCLVGCVLEKTKSWRRSNT